MQSPFPATDFRTAALAQAEAAIARSFGGRVVPRGPASPPVQQYRPAERVCVRGINRRTREKNLAALTAWTQARLDFASTMPAVEREAFCTRSADTLHGWMLALGEPDTPRHLAGLEAVDLELAALRLAGAA